MDKDCSFLIFAGFVDGYGGVAKVRRTVRSLTENNVTPFIATEERYVPKLARFGLSPDLVISRGRNTAEDYENVLRALDGVGYRCMISFGPRTFGPRHAVEKGKKVVIIDGGLPPFLGDDSTDHDHQVYQEVYQYTLTCHFPWRINSLIREQYPKIDINVSAQPVDRQTLDNLVFHRELTAAELAAERKRFLENRLDQPYQHQVIFSLRMSSSLLNPKNLKTNGGWLDKREYTQAVGFVQELIKSLGRLEEDIILTLNADIASRFKILLQKHRLKTVQYSFLPPEECIRLSRIAHLNIDRGMRTVTGFEIAASGSYSVVCPCPTDYMHEDASAEDAERQGIIRLLPIETPELGKNLLQYVQSSHYHHSRDRRLEVCEWMLKERNLIDLLAGLC